MEAFLSRVTEWSTCVWFSTIPISIPKMVGEIELPGIKSTVALKLFSRCTFGTPWGACAAEGGQWWDDSKAKQLQWPLSGRTNLHQDCPLSSKAILHKAKRAICLPLPFLLHYSGSPDWHCTHNNDHRKLYNFMSQYGPSSRPNKKSEASMGPGTCICQFTPHKMDI